MSRLNWAIFNGAEFESLVHSILFFEDPTIILFGRPGADAGQDAITGDKTHVYQAKYGKTLTFGDAIKRAKEELIKIRAYKKEANLNFQHWKNVNHWTLVCNATINPSDNAKWELEIKEPFANLGMELDYWDATILEAKLTNCPDVENAYFGGKNRCFLGIWEAQKYLEHGFLGDTFFQSQFLNQKQASQVFDTFIADSTKKILILKGDQGSGKTRFLYEHALKLCDNGYIPFWGLSTTMEVSDLWFLGITNSKKERCLIVDNVSLSLLERIYEQLSVVGRSSWKVVVSIGGEISNLHLEKYKQRYDTLVTSLVPLDVSDISNYMKAFGYDPKRTKPHSIEQQLFALTRGNPYFLSIILSKNSSNSQELCLTSEVLASVNGYIQEKLQCSNTFTSKLQGNILRWISLYKTICINPHHQNSNICDFLCKELQCTQNDLRENLNSLAENNFLIRWGKSEIHYTLDSDLIRNEILQNWLFEKTGNETYALNTSGRCFIEELLEKNIPNIDAVLKNLGLLAIVYLPSSERRIFFSPLFVKIRDKSLCDDILACEKGLQSLKQVAHLNFDGAVSLLKKIWEHAKTCAPKNVSTWCGDVLYTAQDLLPMIEEIIFSIAYSTADDDSPSTIWQLIKDYYNEISATSQIEHTRFYAHLLALLKDITVGSYYRELAFNEVFPLKKICSKFLLVIIKSLLTPKHESTAYYKKTITFSTRYIVPGSKDWENATTLRKSLFEKLQEADVSEDVESAYWQILINTHNQWRDIDHSRHSNLPIETQLYAIALEDLNKTHEIISTKQMPLKTLLMVRQMWEYALRYPKEQKEKQIAEQCENVFKQYLPWDFATLFSWHEKNEGNNLVGDIVTFIGGAKNSEDINIFFTSATEFLNLKGNSYDCSRSQEILDQTFDLYAYKKQPAFCEFINTGIKHAKGFGTFKDTFFVLFLKRWIHFIKDQEGNQTVSQELIHLLKDSPTQGDLLHSVYAKSAPSSLGGTTTDEFNYLFSHKDDFTFEQFIEILPTFLNVAEKEIKVFVLNTFEQNKNNSQQLNKLWFRFANAAYHVILYENDLDIPNPISWLMQAFVDFGINGEYLEEYSIERLAELGNYKFSQVNFLSLIEQRVALVQEGDSNFEILSTDFQVDKWVSSDQDDNVIQQLCELIFKGETYFSRHQLPKQLPDLTQDITPIINYIQNVLSKKSEPLLEKLYNLGRILSFYSDETQEWEQMVMPLCKAIYQSEIDKRDRYGIYTSFQNRSQVYAFRIGEIPSEVVQRKEFVEKKLLVGEVPVYLREYWKWSLDCVQRDFNHFADEAEAQKYE